MKTLLVAKGGSPFRTREASQSRGEQGETEGLIRHLRERNDVEIVYFGLYHGEHLVEVIEPNLVLEDWLDDAGQKEGFRLDIEALQDLNLIGFIQTAGYAPTFSMIDNPNLATVQEASTRYTAPMHNVLNHFKIPRIVVNNDPRTYPRDQEMSKGWPYSRPAALLDQWDKDWKRRVGGVTYKVRSVHSRCESWAWQSTRENQDLDPCVCVAHAHFTTGIKNDSEERRRVWENILGGELPDNFYVYGEGWDDWDIPWEGSVKPDVALELFNMHTTGPCVSHSPGFYTGKPYVMMSQGCIPLLDEYYDPKGLFGIVPRITKPGQLRAMSHTIHESVDMREEWRSRWKRVLQPDWTMLDALVDDLVAGTFEEGKYGGYFK